LVLTRNILKLFSANSATRLEAPAVGCEKKSLIFGKNSIHTLVAGQPQKILATRTVIVLFSVAMQKATPVFIVIRYIIK